MDVALGFDTSCYTTSVAAVDETGTVVAFQRMLLPVRSGQRGLRQSEAVFAHVRQLPLLASRVAEALGTAGICAVAASCAPREGSDSYMPVFTVGEGHGRATASLLRVPFYPVTHQQGHIAAGQLGNAEMDSRFVALHLSGGTTDLLLCEHGALTLLGATLDLNAGQLVDRIGVAMGLPFPAGPKLEALALNNLLQTEALLPASLTRGDLDCHLSGAETQCLRWIAAETYPRERIAAEAFDLLARTVARMITAACKHTGARQALAVGGVASSTLLRKLIADRMSRLNRTLDLRFGKPEYSADNAAGVAWLGMRRYLAERKTGDGAGVTEARQPGGDPTP
ncbi:MAG: hypothetical protein GX418_07140 [Clostridiales bacterium]|nr:hypothetical protein [Clostridiales bacterium]